MSRLGLGSRISLWQSSSGTASTRKRHATGVWPTIPPGVTGGLLPYVDTIIELHFGGIAKHARQTGCLPIEMLEVSKLRCHFELEVGHITSASLGDWQCDRDDWVSACIGTVSAYCEGAYRDSLYLPAAVDRFSLLFDIETLRDNLFGGLRHQLKGVERRRAGRFGKTPRRLSAGFWLSPFRLDGSAPCVPAQP
jgi:hypothetical protein